MLLTDSLSLSCLFLAGLVHSTHLKHAHLSQIYDFCVTFVQQVQLHVLCSEFARRRMMNRWRRRRWSSRHLRKCEFGFPRCPEDRIKLQAGQIASNIKQWCLNDTTKLKNKLKNNAPTLKPGIVSRQEIQSGENMPFTRKATKCANPSPQLPFCA